MRPTIKIQENTDYCMAERASMVAMEFENENLTN
jgi:hypothetical protein